MCCRENGVLDVLIFNLPAMVGRVLSVDGLGGDECTDLWRGEGVGRSRLETALPYVIEHHEEALVWHL